MKHAFRGSLVAACCVAAVAGAWAAGKPVPANPAPAKLNSSDASYLLDAMATNQSEIDAATYAIKHVTTPRVQQYAQEVLRDDTQTLADLQRANDGSIPTPDPGTQARFFFAGKSGTDLDKAYLDLMIASLDVAVGKCQVATEVRIYGPAVHANATRTLPIIRRHDAEAKSLEQSLPAQEK